MKFHRVLLTPAQMALISQSVHQAVVGKNKTSKEVRLWIQIEGQFQRGRERTAARIFRGRSFSSSYFDKEQN